MSPKPVVTLAATLGCIFSLNSCEVFKKDAPAEDPYAAANPYAAGTQNPAASPSNAYGGNAGAYDAAGAYTQPAPGAYTQPNYNVQPQPYVQPPAAGYPGTTGAGYAGGYDSGGYAGVGSPAPRPVGPTGRTHQVVRGDTLSAISRRYGVGVSDLMRANNLNTDKIIEGQKLNVP